jgi:NAD(P)-dependent dehydrogenase (short-subunit alcohol dehydrogenase family)
MPRPVLLIAGGSRGIGAATAELAGTRGYDVAVNYKSNAEAAARVVGAVKSAGGNAVALGGDMAIEEDIERVFDATVAQLGPLTHLVHSAGVTGKTSRLEDAGAATLREVIDINVYGALLCARAAVRRMSTARGGSGGSIVLLSSIASVIGGAGEFIPYAASKGAIDTLTLGLAREVAKNGIRVNAVRPGIIDTDIHPPGPRRADHAAPADRPARPGGGGGRNHSVPVVGCCVLRHRRAPQRDRRTIAGRATPFPVRPRQNHEIALHRLQRSTGAGVAAGRTRRRSAD